MKIGIYKLIFSMVFISEKMVGIIYYLTTSSTNYSETVSAHTHTDQNIHHDLQFQNPPGRLSATAPTTKYSSLDW